jgi:hypothetical protein
VRLMVSHVIDAVRNQLALACRAQIIGKGFHRLGGEGRPCTVTIP